MELPKWPHPSSKQHALLEQLVGAQTREYVLPAVDETTVDVIRKSMSELRKKGWSIETTRAGDLDGDRPKGVREQRALYRLEPEWRKGLIGTLRKTPDEAVRLKARRAGFRISARMR